MSLEVRLSVLLRQTRYNRLTPLAKKLQQDPSCHLLTVLRRYVRHMGVKGIEESVAGDAIPQMFTIHKGILALLRQWKTILHMPVETSFKTKKKVQFVPFPFDDEEEGDAANKPSTFLLL